MVFGVLREARLSPLGIPAAAPVDFKVFTLVHNDGSAGTTSDSFRLLEAPRSSAPYCNADMALGRRFLLPLPSDYAGPKTKDGC